MYKLITYFVFCLSLFLLTCYNCYSQGENINAENFLENRINITFNNDDEELFLKTFARRASVPLGFYQLNGKDGERKKISVSVKQETIRNILDKFIESDPRYKWEVVDGVINIIPKEQPSLLKVSVSKVDFVNIKLEDAEFAILELPEVRLALSELNISASKISINNDSVSNKSLFSLRLESTNIQQILNEILRNKYGYYWTVEQYGKNFEYIEVRLS